MSPVIRRLARSGRTLAAAALVVVAGCRSVGPPSVTRDRFDYGAAISDSWKTQMLANLVRARYLEAPVFVEIESAISSYSLDVGASAGAEFHLGLPDQVTSVPLGANLAYSDRPTITYAPLVGEKFTKSLMTPIPPVALLTLIQAGWSSELLFRCCVASVNGLRNNAARALASRPADPEFARLVELMSKIQAGGGMGLRVVSDADDKTEATIFFSKPKPDPSIAAEVAEAQKLLGVDASAGEYRVGFGLFPKGEKEVALLTRSMLDVLFELAAYIEVPPEHEAEGRTSPGVSAGQAQAGARPLLLVHSGTSRPQDAFVAIPYHGHWFWIDDRDRISKGVFSFLMFLFTLTETGGGGVSPVVTVPVR
jgi:hypothetical protein